MDRCIGRHDIIEILLKMALNTVQSTKLTDNIFNLAEMMVIVSESTMLANLVGKGKNAALGLVKKSGAGL